MDSAKNGRWIISFKKFGMVRERSLQKYKKRRLIKTLQEQTIISSLIQIKNQHKFLNFEIYSVRNLKKKLDRQTHRMTKDTGGISI